jgi:hypothetical protein
MAFKDAGLTPDDFEGPRYSRIAHIKKMLADERVDATLRWAQPDAIEVAAYA